MLKLECPRDLAPFPNYERNNREINICEVHFHFPLEWQSKKNFIFMVFLKKKLFEQH